MENWDMAAVRKPRTVERMEALRKSVQTNVTVRKKLVKHMGSLSIGDSIGFLESQLFNACLSHLT